MSTKQWLLGACGGVMLAGGMASTANANLLIDLRFSNTAANTPVGATIAANKKSVLIDSTKLPATAQFNLDVIARINGADIDLTNETFASAIGSFLSTGAIKGQVLALASNGKAAVAPFNTGATAGTQVDIDGDGDKDLGSAPATDVTNFVSMRFGAAGGAQLIPPNTPIDPNDPSAGFLPVQGSAVNGAVEFRIATLKFITGVGNLGAGTPTQILFDLHRNDDGKTAQNGILWTEDDSLATFPLDNTLPNCPPPNFGDPCNSFTSFDGLSSGKYSISGATLSVIPVPEPTSMCLLALGAIGMAARRRRS